MQHPILQQDERNQSPEIEEKKMKQEYRHTKPYRGKDPNFEKEELTEQEINDTLERRLKVNRKLKKTFNKL